MSRTTGIEWTDSTWSPWWGCTRVSPACARCYAAEWAKRWGHQVWDNDEFRFFGDGHWRTPLAWNREAEMSGWPRFVFCASMADVFQDHPLLVEQRERLWDLIDRTPWLVWLLLTKRPENIGRLSGWDHAPPNVWLGTSIENARHTFRTELLCETPAPVHFLSCEPLLGSLFASGGKRRPLELADIEWVIVGGESGASYRPMNLDWARELRDACQADRIPYFFKQHSYRFPKKHPQGKKLDGREWCERPAPATPAEKALALF